MANIFGAIGLNESDRLFNGTVGNEIIYHWTQNFLDLYNADVMASQAIFVESRTDKIQTRYKLPGNGMMQKSDRLGTPALAKVRGQYDVGFPIIDYREMVGSDDITWAYMTVDEWSIQVQGVRNKNVNTIRFELLKALFNNVNVAFVDEQLGSTTVRRLANTDGSLYPPVLGSTTEAQAEAYAGSNYAASAISNTNNPVKTIVDALQSRWGTPTGGSNIAVFYNSAQDALIQALADFVKIQYHLVQPGDNTAVPIIPGIDSRLLQGSWEVTGTCNGAVMCKWANIPAGYMLGIHLDAPAPLMERVDPAFTGLAPGLQLVWDQMDKIWKSAMWRHRFGYGVGNRLNGYVMQLVASTSYTIPTIYQ